MFLDLGYKHDSRDVQTYLKYIQELDMLGFAAGLSFRKWLPWKFSALFKIPFKVKEC